MNTLWQIIIFKCKKIIMNKFQVFSITMLLGLKSWGFGEPPIPNPVPISSQTANLRCSSTVPNFSEKAKINFIKNWAMFVADKSFSLKYNNLDYQLKQLQFCFSSSGWNQFYQALQKSGNLNLITTNQLSANTQVIGPVAINHHPKFSSWTAVVPLRVVYQNQKQKISQEINVHLTINQLKDDHLAVIQIVGKPSHRNLPQA